MTMLLTSPKRSQTGVVPVQLVAALVIAALAGGAAWTYQASRYTAQIATMQRDHATAAQATTEANARHLVRVWERGDSLAAQLASQQADISQLHPEHTHAIKRLTTGRPCLSADLVRVLNNTQPAATDRPDALPTPTSGPAATDASAFATDADVSTWAATARREYAECAARLGALIDWHGPAQLKNKSDERLKDFAAT